MITNFQVARAGGGQHTVKAHDSGGTLWVDLADVGYAMSYPGNLISWAKKHIPRDHRRLLNGGPRKSMLVSRTGLSALCDSMSKKKGDRLRFVLSQINRALGVKAEPAEEINGDRLLIDGIPARRVNGNRVVVKDVINAMRIKVGRFNMSEYLEGLDASLEPIRVQMGRSAKCYGNVFAYTIPESNIEALTERLKTISLSWGRPVELVEPEVIEATIVEPSDEVFTQAEDPEVSALVPFSDFSFEGKPVRTHVMEDITAYENPTKSKEIG